MSTEREARREALLNATARLYVANRRALYRPAPETLREREDAAGEADVARRIFEDGDAARE